MRMIRIIFFTEWNFSQIFNNPPSSSLNIPPSTFQPSSAKKIRLYDKATKFVKKNCHCIRNFLDKNCFNLKLQFCAHFVYRDEEKTLRFGLFEIVKPINDDVAFWMQNFWSIPLYEIEIKLAAFHVADDTHDIYSLKYCWVRRNSKRL